MAAGDGGHRRPAYVRCPRYRAGAGERGRRVGITLTVSGEWLAIAEACGYDALIRLARAAHDEAL
jgi:hypothetical protein